MNNDDGAPEGAADGRVRHLVPVDGDTAPRTLSPKHLADLESSGLDATTIEAAGVYSEGTSGPVAEILGWPWRHGGGLVFPFRDYDSNKVVLARVKPDKPRTRPSRTGASRKPIKYEQAPGTGAIPFIGPRTIREQRFGDAARQVVWTEGEKKTLLLDQLGCATIGLTGCHNFNDAEAAKNGDGLVWAKALRKYAERFVRGRLHVICFDSDAWGNDNVLLALRRLAGLLLEGGALAVKFVRIPGDANDADRHIGIDDFFVEHGEEKTRALLATLEPIAPGEDVTPVAPRDPLVKLASLPWLRGARLDGDLRLPPGFEIRRDRSLWIDPPEGEQKEIMRAVAIPVQLFDAIDDDEQRVDVAYHARNEWQKGTVDRKGCRDARRALPELPPGVTVDSNNAAAVVHWFGEFLRHNEGRLRSTRYASQCGWQALDDERAFVLDTPISSNETSTLVADPVGERGEIVRSLVPRGEYEEHKAALLRAFHADPIAAVTILGALAVPLLSRLGAPNFAINLYGDSSRGKTTIVKIAGSVYGDPKNEQWIGSWNSTPVAMELRAATLTDLPLCFDEVGAGDTRVIERTIYMLINGAGRARGDRALNVRKAAHWNTIVLSTGEHELVDDRASTGAQVRVLQFRVAGFGALDAAGVDSIREACERNHGHVGRRWIEALVDVDDWRPYVDLFEQAKAEFREVAGGQLAKRQAVYQALLCLTEHLAASALGIGELNGETMRRYFDGDANGSEARSLHESELRTANDRALESISQWIVTEGESFPPLDTAPDGKLVSRKGRTPPRKTFGARHKGLVYILTGELRARFDLGGFSYQEVITAWREREFTECDKGRNDTRTSWDGQRSRVVALRCSAIGLDDALVTSAQTEADFGN